MVREDDKSTLSDGSLGNAIDAIEFTLTPEWRVPAEQPCKTSMGPRVIDVNLGHSPEALVAATWWQATGNTPPKQKMDEWRERVESPAYPRRIDIVRAICEECQVNPTLAYSDPWREQLVLDSHPGRRVTRDVGAVCMFFFNTPDGLNGRMNWANTHAPGMDEAHPILGFGDNPTGFYNPSDNPGFWYREMMDARYAGLQFLLLGTYGPDITDGRLDTLRASIALMETQGIQGLPKIAFFDDTWIWGHTEYGPPWGIVPSLNDPVGTGSMIYASKWKPFFEAIPVSQWYRIKGRPFVYFYNGGTLKPLDKSAPLIVDLKSRFKKDFGVEPWVAVDSAFFADPRMPQVGDAQFTWCTLANNAMPRSRSMSEGLILDHAMVKWDAVNRKNENTRATTKDRVIKGDQLLKQALDASLDADVLVLATWNDLGEGTGINRNYDYYFQRRWLQPNHFMNLIRASQLGMRLL